MAEPLLGQGQTMMAAPVACELRVVRQFSVMAPAYAVRITTKDVQATDAPALRVGEEYRFLAPPRPRPWLMALAPRS
jgi:hypothetical protein